MKNTQVRYWDQKDHPITRFALYLTDKGLWSEQQEKEWKNESKKQVNFTENKLDRGYRVYLFYVILG